MANKKYSQTNFHGLKKGFYYCYLITLLLLLPLPSRSQTIIDIYTKTNFCVNTHYFGLSISKSVDYVGIKNDFIDIKNVPHISVQNLGDVDIWAISRNGEKLISSQTRCNLMIGYCEADAVLYSRINNNFTKEVIATAGCIGDAGVCWGVDTCGWGGMNVFTQSDDGSVIIYPQVIPDCPELPGGCCNAHLTALHSSGEYYDLGVSTTMASISNEGDKIVFNAGRYYPSGDAIFIKNTKNLNTPIQIIGLGSPVISGNGNKIIYNCSDGGLCLSNSDGSGQQKLISDKNPLSITTNYDGTLIAFSAKLAGKNDSEIFLYHVPTGNLSQITNNLDYDDSEPRMADDGNFIWGSSPISCGTPPWEGNTKVYLYLLTGETKKGDYQKVDLGWGVVMIYPHVFLEGRTRMEVDDQGPELPAGFAPGSPQTYYHISTTAGYEGEILLCITYDETAYGGEERVLHLLHSHGIAGDWQDITVILDTEQNQICGLTPDLSDFTIAIGPPWPPYEPPPPSGPSLSSTDDDSSSCGSLPGSQGAGLGAGILLITCLLALRRFRKIWSKK